jgi:hypothetical protein
MSVVDEEVERLKKEVVSGQKLRPTTDARSVTKAARSARPQRPGQQLNVTQQIPYQELHAIIRRMLESYKA